MSDRIVETATIKAAQAPVSGISVPAHMGIGSELVHAIDYVVLIQVLFNVSSQARSTPVIVWEQLKTRGIRSAKNSKELVGRDAVYSSFGRLIDAGYIRRVELPNKKHPGRKGPISYTVYDNPAWNPDWQVHQVASDPLENMQVGMLPGTPEAVKPEAEETAGRNASRNAGSGEAGSGVPGSGGRRVPAGQNASGVPGSVRPSPPHPPEEEVGTTSPSIPKHAATPRRGKTSSNDDTLDPAQRDKAIKFLMNLPGAWAVGLTRARGLAGKLIANSDATGWELDTALRLYLTRHEAGKNPVENYGATLAYRIAEMQMKDAVLAAAAEASEPAGPAAGAAPSKPGHVDWCGECDSPTYRFLVPDDGPAAKCKTCHPAYAATRA
ncbi:hypothetical protein ACFWW5_10880 [Streptomyces albidoflavus]